MNKFFTYAFAMMFIAGIVLVLVSNNILSLSIATASVAPSLNGQQLGASMSSSNPNKPILLSIFGPNNLTAGTTYQWKLTVKNTGTIPWSAGHVTIRIASLVGSGANSAWTPYLFLSSANYSQFQAMFGPGVSGTGVLQSCYIQSTNTFILNSTACLVNVNGNRPTTALNESWRIEDSSNGNLLSSNGLVAVVPLPSGGLAAGSSMTLSFDAVIPGLTAAQFGNYYALENLVAYAPSSNGGIIVDNNVVTIALSSGVAGVLTTEGITAIAGAVLSIAGLGGLAMAYMTKRRT